MKRLIKFRGKRTDTGEWVFGDLIHGVGSKHGRMYILPVTHIYPKGCNDLDGWEVIPDTIGQFTGLLDKNKTEVYDGDLIKAPSGRIYLVMWSTWVHQERRNKWIVDEYQFTGWCMGYERGKPIDTLDSEVLQGEVIGNGFDNLNLIQYDITEAKGNCTNK